MKTFVLYECPEDCSVHDEDARGPLAVLLADSLEDANRIMCQEWDGNRIEEDSYDSVLFRREVFTPTTEGDEYFRAGDMLEFKAGPLHLHLHRRDVPDPYPGGVRVVLVEVPLVNRFGFKVSQ